MSNNCNHYLIVIIFLLLISCENKITTPSNSNTPPTASISIAPETGTFETVFTIDASGCLDSEDPVDSLKVRWDWENDGTWDTDYSVDKTTTHTFTTNDRITIKLKVKDTGGLTDSTTKQILINDITVTDKDGNVYKTIKIGNQWWMAENLKVTHYRNGDLIPNVTSNSEWIGLSTGAYCAFINDANNESETYGYLYNWYAINDSRDIAPEGWHVPTDAEWKELEMALGMSQSEADDTEFRGTNEGSKLAGMADLWVNGDLENNSSFDESGFSALPGGYRFSSSSGSFTNLGSRATFWSSTESNRLYAWRRYLYYNYSEVYRYYSNKRRGFSVRLVRD